MNDEVHSSVAAATDLPRDLARSPIPSSAEQAFELRQSRNLIEQIGHLNQQMTDLAEENALLKAELEKAERPEAQAADEGDAPRGQERGGAIAKPAFDALLTLLPGREENDIGGRMRDGSRHHHQALCSIVTALAPSPVATGNLDDVSNVAGYYNLHGVSGCIEAVHRSDDAATYHGWATARAADFTALLITVYDADGCIGVAVPSVVRLDVAAELEGCVQRCGFTIDVIRSPRNEARVYCHVAPRHGEPVIFALSGR